MTCMTSVALESCSVISVHPVDYTDSVWEGTAQAVTTRKEARLTGAILEAVYVEVLGSMESG